MRNRSGSPLAIVIGRNYTTRLSLIRAAGMVGCDVVVIQTQKSQKDVQRIDASSRFVVDCKISREPDQRELIDTILQYKDGAREKLILPADDYAAATVDLYFDELKDYFVFPHVNHTPGAVIQLMNKSFQKQLAQEAGFQVAKGWVCKMVDGVYQIPDVVTFPCFTKPQDSCQGPLKHYQRKCGTRKDLESVLSEIAQIYNGSILVEEYVDIEREYGVQGTSLNGVPIIPGVVLKDKSRQGLTATGVICPISRIPSLEDKLRAFMEKTCFTGVFDVDLYEAEGKLFFNELNVRLGANGFALIYGVANVPGIFIKEMLGMHDDLPAIPGSFNDMRFASEKVLRDMYYDNAISYRSFNSSLKEADILSLKCKTDDAPYKVFWRNNTFLPLRKGLHCLKVWAKNRLKNA